MLKSSHLKLFLNKKKQKEPGNTYLSKFIAEKVWSYKDFLVNFLAIWLAAQNLQPIKMLKNSIE